MKMINNVLFGSDIEVFLKDKNTGKILDASPYIKGTKIKPKKFYEGYLLSLDNVCCEFGTPPVREDVDFLRQIGRAISYINNITPREISVEPIACAYLDKEQLRKKSARTFGCIETINCWTCSENNVPNFERTNLRTSGLHLHCGYDNPTEEKSLYLARALDLFLSVPSVLIEEKNERRKYYGKSGEMRFKPYGLEIRTLSSSFINGNLPLWVIEQANKAIDFVNNGGLLEPFSEIGKVIQNTVNNYDKEVALQLCNEYNILNKAA
jgi:Phage phiEco32-like COOH.NH2 ligase-type 2